MSAEGDIFQGVLNNDGFSRDRSGEPQVMADSMIIRLSDAVNSVHYFLQVPYVVKAPAAVVELLGEDEVEGRIIMRFGLSFAEKEGAQTRK